MELKYIQCKIIGGKCDFALKDECMENIRKAYKYDKQAFGEWVADEIVSRSGIRGEQLLDARSTSPIFKDSKTPADALYKLQEKIGKNRITVEQLWDTLCKTAIDFNKENNEK
ncbi:hypothetical protein LCGC14_1488860 [marine sediment metagenome]|uniref:Uncharacterized protein n=1 Tax=marine sediment metagenome TaxID=412755 RepID=A0A0F9M966_9ZZZZ